MEKEFDIFVLKKLDDPAIVHHIKELCNRKEELCMHPDDYIKLFRLEAQSRLREEISFGDIVIIYLPISFILFLISSMLIEYFRNSEIVYLLASFGRKLNSDNEFPKEYYYAIYFLFNILSNIQFIVFVFIFRSRLVIFYSIKSFKYFLLYYIDVILLVSYIILWLFFMDTVKREAYFFDEKKNYFGIISGYLFISVSYAILLYRLTSFSRLFYTKMGMDYLENYFIALRHNRDIDFYK